MCSIKNYIKETTKSKEKLEFIYTLIFLILNPATFEGIKQVLNHFSDKKDLFHEFISSINLKSQHNKWHPNIFSRNYPRWLGAGKQIDELYGYDGVFMLLKKIGFTTFLLEPNNFNIILNLKTLFNYDVSNISINKFFSRVYYLLFYLSNDSSSFNSYTKIQSLTTLKEILENISITNKVLLVTTANAIQITEKVLDKIIHLLKNKL